MFTSILKKIGGLTHKELVELRAIFDTEITYREGLEPIAWVCPGCDFSAPSWAEVVNHAKEKHSLESTSKGYGIAYPPKAVWP